MHRIGTKYLAAGIAAGGMSALERRYSSHLRRRSRRCVQLAIAEGRFHDIRDIGQHPESRG